MILLRYSGVFYFTEFKYLKVVVNPKIRKNTQNFEECGMSGLE